MEKKGPVCCCQRTHFVSYHHSYIVVALQQLATILPSCNNYNVTVAITVLYIYVHKMEDGRKALAMHVVVLHIHDDFFDKRAIPNIAIHNLAK